jgi:hypothetical protein
MKLDIINPLLDPDWDRGVLEHPEFSFFHSSAWARVLVRSYQHQPVYLRCGPKNRPAALLPMMEVQSTVTGRRGVSLPFTDSCEPLLFSEHSWEPLFKGLSEMARERRWKRFELRGAGRLERLTGSANNFVGHTLGLSDSPEALFSRFTSANRRAIRKAEKRQLRIEASQSRNSLQCYYQLHLLTRKRHGLPPQPWSFFENIHEEVISSGLGFVVMAHHRTTPVAGAVFFHFGRSAVYKFGASDANYQELRGNNLVMWEAIRLLNRGGFQRLHFGRTSLANEGLRNFKLGWGAQESPLPHLSFQPATGQWKACADRSRGLHNLFFGKLPSKLNSLAGALIYPHLD